MVAIIDRIGYEVDAIDVFCGFGGSSQGIHAAGATVRAAANHSELAIECHAANYPNVDHWQADLSDPNNPQVVNRKGKKVSGRYLDPEDLPRARFAWFSPSCKHHSQANAKKVYMHGPSIWDQDGEANEFDQVAYANSERSRVSMMCVIRYAAKHHPEIIVVENVVEAAKWGPNRDGSTFQWWLRELTKHGYLFECLFLNSQFFPPCPQSRDRMYVVAWRRGNRRPNLDYTPVAYCESDVCGGKIVSAVQTWKNRTKAWPLARWGKYGAQYRYSCSLCKREVIPAAWPAYAAIDWKNLGTAIGDRSALGMKPLADKTMDRIRRGVGKFRNGPPIVIPAKSTWGVDRTVVEPFTTQTSQQEKALVTEGFVIPAAGNTHEREKQIRAKSLGSPLYTQHTTLSFGFAHVPVLIEQRNGGSIKAGQHPVTSPAHTVTGGGGKGGLHHGLVSPAVFAKFNGGPEDTAWHGLQDSLNTVTGRDSTGLIVLPWVEQFNSDPVGVTEQLATVMTHLRHALANINVDDLESVSNLDLEQVRFRMLDPDPELRRAMAFADDYILLGGKSAMTEGLGNAVTPPTASWITEQCLATLRDEEMVA